MNTSIQELWIMELNEFMVEYKKWLKLREDEEEDQTGSVKSKKTKKRVKSKMVVK